MLRNTPDVFNNRKQIRHYLQEIAPDHTIIKNALEKTYDLVPSKQSLIPYKVHVVGPFNEKVNKALYETSTFSGVLANRGLLTAPYNFVYEVRLSQGNSAVQHDIDVNGHIQPVMDKNLYKRRDIIKNTTLEIGMHAAVLSSILLENNLDISYTLCFENNENGSSERWNHPALDFITDEVQFIMSTGYSDNEKYWPAGEEKPEIAEVINWIKKNPTQGE